MNIFILIIILFVLITGIFYSKILGLLLLLTALLYMASFSNITNLIFFSKKNTEDKKVILDFLFKTTYIVTTCTFLQFGFENLFVKILVVMCIAVLLLDLTFLRIKYKSSPDYKEKAPNIDKILDNKYKHDPFFLFNNKSKINKDIFALNEISLSVILCILSVFLLFAFSKMEINNSYSNIILFLFTSIIIIVQFFLVKDIFSKSLHEKYYYSIQLFNCFGYFIISISLYLYINYGLMPFEIYFSSTGILFLSCVIAYLAKIARICSQNIIDKENEI